MHEAICGRIRAHYQNVWLSVLHTCSATRPDQRRQRHALAHSDQIARCTAVSSLQHVVRRGRQAGHTPPPHPCHCHIAAVSCRLSFAIFASNYKKKMHRISLSVLHLHCARIDQSHLISLDCVRATTCGYLVSAHIIGANRCASYVRACIPTSECEREASARVMQITRDALGV